MASGTASCWRSTPPPWDWPWTRSIRPSPPWPSHAGWCAPMVRCSLLRPLRNLLRRSSNNLGISSAASRAWSSMGSQSELVMQESGLDQGAEGCLGCISAVAGQEPVMAIPVRTGGSAKRTLVEVSSSKSQFLTVLGITRYKRNVLKEYILFSNNEVTCQVS